VKGSYTPYKTSGKASQICAFEVRGIDIVALKLPNHGFDAEGMEGTKFKAIDLSSGDWSEFDEERNSAVSIMNIETKLEITK